MQGLPECRSFTLEELKEATNNFDNSAFMGEGSCGKVPYKTFDLVKMIGERYGKDCCDRMDFIKFWIITTIVSLVKDDTNDDIMFCNTSTSLLQEECHCSWFITRDWDARDHLHRQMSILIELILLIMNVECDINQTNHLSFYIYHTWSFPTLSPLSCSFTEED